MWADPDPIEAARTVLAQATDLTLSSRDYAASDSRYVEDAARLSRGLSDLQQSIRQLEALETLVPESSLAAARHAAAVVGYTLETEPPTSR